MQDRTHGTDDDALRSAGDCTILLVEDDDIVRMLTLEVLMELEYQVLEAADAQQALLVLESDQPLDLLMTDIGLPGMDGHQLMIRARSLRPQLPVLFASGYGEGVPSQTGEGAATATITKPYSLDLLRSTVQNLLG
ncbi:MAG: response regulator [Gammaproteobacteria bacterium]|nr:response regulator [Gammaproteobacteria bacterium]MBU1491474.1 response regulator [Gammaproteobacteria bacterium]MBU2066220.1 response regulator [Gammaproteobacteria bacterium]MBU2139882.1 response regulator [Gammaproteobacteria bacterium]MBU2215537.1 response regulator [Gammaproteobacteria bacterium]